MKSKSIFVVVAVCVRIDKAKQSKAQQSKAWLSLIQLQWRICLKKERERERLREKKRALWMHWMLIHLLSFLSFISINLMCACCIVCAGPTLNCGLRAGHESNCKKMSEEDWVILFTLTIFPNWTNFCLSLQRNVFCVGLVPASPLASEIYWLCMCDDGDKLVRALRF